MTPPITSHCGAPLKIFRYSIQISYQLRNISRFGVFHRVLYSVQYPMGIQWLKTWFGKEREGWGRVVANDLMGPRQLTCFCLFPCPAMTSNKPFEFLLYTKNWLHIFVVVCTYSVIDVTAWYSTSSRGPLFCKWCTRGSFCTWEAREPNLLFVCMKTYSHSEYGLETQLKSLFYLFVSLMQFCARCMVTEPIVF